MSKVADGTTTTPLHIAAERGHYDVVSFFLAGSQKFAANQTDSNGATALHYAAAFGCTSVVWKLLERGARWDLTLPANGCAPFFLAAQNNHDGVLRLLLNPPNAQPEAATKLYAGPQGVEPLNSNAKPLTAYSVAKANGHIEVAKLVGRVIGQAEAGDCMEVDDWSRVQKDSSTGEFFMVGRRVRLTTKCSESLLQKIFRAYPGCSDWDPVTVLPLLRTQRKGTVCDISVSSAGRHVDESQDAERGSLHVQWGGKGNFVATQARLVGNTLTFTETVAANYAGTSGEVVTADVLMGKLSAPKSERKGFPHAFRLDLPSPDSRGCAKYLLATDTADDKERWELALETAMQVAANVKVKFDKPTVRSGPMRGAAGNPGIELWVPGEVLVRTGQTISQKYSRIESCKHGATFLGASKPRLRALREQPVRKGFMFQGTIPGTKENTYVGVIKANAIVLVAEQRKDRFGVIRLQVAVEGKKMSGWVRQSDKNGLLLETVVSAEP